MDVLVVSDEQDTRELVGATVEEVGHAASFAMSAGYALDRIRHDAPEIVVVSVELPDMDATDLCRQIRDTCRNDPYVIVLTRPSGQEQALAAMDAGADDAMTVPFDPFDLRVRLVRAEGTAALRHRAAEAARRTERAEAMLQVIARTDTLTGLGNRLRFDEDLAALHARALRSGSPYAVVMVDVDHFKPYNDHHGHQAGDAALRAISNTIAANCRAGDRAYRYGGEELAILFHGESVRQAVGATDRFRRAVRDLAITHDARPDEIGLLTISAGVAGFDPALHPAARDVVEDADRALYRAKRSGRDRVVAATSSVGEDAAAES